MSGFDRPAFMGKGLSFPLQEDPSTGDFKRVADEDNVTQCLEQLCLTRLMERMDPTVGTVLPDLVFESEDLVADLGEPSIRRAVETHEPRVRLTGHGVTVEPVSDATAGLFNVRVDYVIRATNKRSNRVFPFTTNEE
jgi:phage baseplate assembly protein W